MFNVLIGNAVTVLNSTVSDNTAAVGGGLLNLYGSWLIANSTISGNQATVQAASAAVWRRHLERE